jgi:type II secretory ATPase GspE/PulE/Tfp pilus assembly ATPase PilB-like protein
MVGEIRDGETAELVTHAALTGHLVLSTLHTNDSAGALPRLFNLKVEPFLLTSAINAVIAQRLVRKICPKCREEIQVPQSVMFEVKKELGKLNLTSPLKFYRGRGCENCNNGFSGRVGIFEVLTMTSEIETLVLNKKSADEMFKSAVGSGMITMRQDGFIKVIKGVTTVDEVFRVTSESKEG